MAPSAGSSRRCEPTGTTPTASTPTPRTARIIIGSSSRRTPTTKSADAIIASTSPHHVADLDIVVELIIRRLAPDGVLVVVEWAQERFDEATARWCFDRLANDEPGWLHRHRDDWLTSGE